MVRKLLALVHTLCRVFIGQASGKAVGVGMRQAEEKNVLTDFTVQAINTLVASGSALDQTTLVFRASLPTCICIDTSQLDASSYNSSVHALRCLPKVCSALVLGQCTFVSEQLD